MTATNIQDQATRTRCLVLACGNTLRRDDGIGLLLGQWAEERFRPDPRVQVILRQQFTVELVADIAAADSVLFIDASLKAPAGRVRLTPVSSRVNNTPSNSHTLSPNQLLVLTRSLYGSIKSHAMLLAVGISSTDLGEKLSEPVEAAIPHAKGILKKAVLRFLAD